LTEPIIGIRPRFFDAKPEFRWHAGTMLPRSALQTSYLKDLVTLVDPTNRYSFLNFLVLNGRIYRAIVANKVSCSRYEFEQYFRWVANQLTTIEWGERVETVRISNNTFEVMCGSGLQVATTSLVIGTGRVPAMPDFAAAHIDSAEVLHSSEMLNTQRDFRGRRVLVVGAGQSGAEIVDFLLSRDHMLPSSITWISSRTSFLPMDNSPFSNEWFAAPYVDYFYGLPQHRRSSLLKEQRLASDGISESLIQNIYERLYQFDIGASSPLRHRLLPSRRVTGLHRDRNGFVATLYNYDCECIEKCEADVVIFCSGYRTVFPDFLDGLRERLVNRHGELHIDPDYSVSWDGPRNLRIYMLNGAEHTHGISDPNLSLIAWRSARVLNALMGRDVYRLFPATTATSWNSDDLSQPSLSVA
jgi:lysine N6-hydroxylase